MWHQDATPAAMRATALLTGTEMNPGSADLDALLAFSSLWVLDAGNGIDVDTTLIGHDILCVHATFGAYRHAPSDSAMHGCH